MIQTSPTMRILVAIEPVDLRKGIDGLAGFCRQKLAQDPLSGCAFVFRNRKGTAGIENPPHLFSLVKELVDEAHPK